MSADGQGTKCRRNIAENSNRLSRVHERYRQTTDGRATAYSEREGGGDTAAVPFLELVINTIGQRIVRYITHERRR